MPGTDIGTITIALGLNTKELVEKAKSADRTLRELLPRNLERKLTLTLNTPDAQDVESQMGDLNNRLDDFAKRKLRLTPKFSVTDDAAKGLRDDIEAKLNKGDGITVKVKLAGLDTLQTDILTAIGTPDIPFTWHWKGDAPPGGGATGGGGGGGGTSGGGTSGGRSRSRKAAPPPEPEIVVTPEPPVKPKTPRKSRATAKPTAPVEPTAPAPEPPRKPWYEAPGADLRAEERESVPVKPKTPRKSRANPARGKVPTDTGSSTGSTAAPPYTPPAGARVVEQAAYERFGIDEMRARPQQMTEEGERISARPTRAEMARKQPFGAELYQETMGRAVTERPEQLYGMRGGGTRLSKEDFAAINTPEARKRRADARREFQNQKDEGRRQASSRLKQGLMPENYDELDDIGKAMAKRDVESFGKWFRALDGVKWDENEFPDVSSLREIDPRMADSAHAMLLGDLPTAAKIASTIVEEYKRPNEGLAKNEKAVRKAGRQLKKTGSAGNVLKADAGVLLKVAWAGATARASKAVTDPMSGLLTSDRPGGSGGKTPSRDRKVPIRDKATGEIVDYRYTALDDPDDYLARLRKALPNFYGAYDASEAGPSPNDPGWYTRATGGPVDKWMSVYKGGSIDNTGTFLRKRDPTDRDIAFVGAHPEVAKGYLGRWRKDGPVSLEQYDTWQRRDATRSMVHEGVIPRSRVASYDLVESLSEKLGISSPQGMDPRRLHEILGKYGFAGYVDEPIAAGGLDEIAVFDPHYLINHLAGPKGELPRAGGGPVWSEKMLSQWAVNSLGKKDWRGGPIAAPDAGPLDTEAPLPSWLRPFQKTPPWAFRDADIGPTLWQVENERSLPSYHRFQGSTYGLADREQYDLEKFNRLMRLVQGTSEAKAKIDPRAGGGKVSTSDPYKIVYRDDYNRYGTSTRVFDAMWGNELAGSVGVHRDADGNAVDLATWVEKKYQHRGIASAIYKYAESHGIPNIEDVSDNNALTGGQLDDGQLFWKKRKERMGWKPEDFARFFETGERPGKSQITSKWGIAKNHLANPNYDVPEGGWGPGENGPWPDPSDLADESDLWKLFDPSFGAHYRGALKLSTGKAGGGRSMRGRYRVGEVGPEYFQSRSGRNDQWLGLGGEHTWDAPEDGNVIPYYKLDPEMRHSLPHLAAGGPALKFHGTKGQVIPESTAARQGWVKGFGEIMRVFVTNWPRYTSASGGGGGGRVGDTASETGTAGPFTKQSKGREEKQGESTSPGRRGGRSPEELNENYLLKRDLGSEFEERMVSARSNISESLQLVPVRALSVSIGQILQTQLGGRAEILKRAKFAEGDIGQAQKDVGELSRRQQNVVDARRAREEFEARVAEGAVGENVDIDAVRARLATNESVATKVAKSFEKVTNTSVAKGVIQGTVGGLKQAQKDIDDQLKAGRLTPTEHATQRESLIAAGKELEGENRRTTGVVTRREQFRTQAVGLGGIVGGTLLFTAAMHAAQLGIELVGQVAMKAADAMTGFSVTASRVTTELAQAVQQQPGFPTAAVGQQFARLGIDPEMAKRFQPLEDQAVFMAGAQNTQQLIDMRRAADFFNGQGGMNGRVRGLGGDFQNGLFNTFINQTPSIGEQLAGEMSRLTNDHQIPIAGTTAAQQFGSAAQHPWWQRVLQGEPVINMPAGLRGLIGSGEDFFTGTQGQTIYGPDTAGQKTFVDEINKFASRGNQGGGPQLEMSGDKLKVQATIDAFTDAGRGDLGKAFTDAGYVLSGTNGAAATAYDANQLMAGYGRGAVMGSPEQMWNSMQKPLQMQLVANQMQGQFQRNNALPVQFGWQQFLNRPLTPGVGVPGGSSLPQVAEMQKKIADMAAPGIAKIRAEVDPQTFADLDKVSADIKSWTERRIKINVDFGEKQYQEQLRVTRRSLSDIIGLAGMRNRITGEGVVQASHLGELQREQLNLGRDQTRFELARSQRQVNFNLSLANISVPGETPAEMAARVNQARAEAADAQTELDFSKKGFKINTEIEDITIGQQAQDALKNFDLMLEGHAVQLETSQLDEALTTSQTLQGQLQAVGQTYTDVALAGEKLVLDTQIQISTQTGTWLTNLGKIPAAYQAIADAQLAGGTGGLDPTGTYPAGTILGPVAPTSDPWGPQHAAGALFSTTGATRMVVGEAGSETIAILRNPRAMDLGGWGGGGGGSITQIIFNGTSVRDDGDIDTIARKVEQVMNRRALAVGVVQ